MESYKGTHSQQNHELVRTNALYASQIRRLEDELYGLRSENLELRERLIRAERQLELKEKQQIVAATTVSAMAMMKKDRLSVPALLGDTGEEGEATYTSATTTAEATAIVKPPSLYLLLDEELERTDDHKQPEQHQQQQLQTNDIDGLEHQRYDNRSNNDTGYRNTRSEESAEPQSVNITRRKDTTNAVMPTPNKRVRTRISYALPSVKQKLRKGDPFTFNDPVPR
ncbi:hypothetical protein BDB00DRAFT_798826 [Zychaea mexicana]|uniref:uncharacterized protein n=1 Tax=Zychaea mexicana TaxID=64656 RepID=UPI0022FF00E6|nr:uncharacterized protein BDB00DRAFT_798826 [Zychaea mexicana]KAI9498634.1 hypothetical protein BDB00DRAFT_798826 [Zychaea mexicana]